MPPRTQTPTAARQSLNAEDWAEAALEALAARGIEAVAVEPLARQLNVTKGSFYWHFRNRDALLQAALELWERRETEDIIARVEQEPDAHTRIVRLFKLANASHRAGRLFLAMAAADGDPAVREVVQRVSRRRLGYLFDCYRALGLTAAEASRWSRFAYATFMGNLALSRDAQDGPPSEDDWSDYLRLMIRTLIPRRTAAARSDRSPAVVPMTRTGSP